MNFRSPTALFAVLLLPFVATAQVGVETYVQSKRFHRPGQGEQVEVAITLMGGSLSPRMDAEGNITGQVEILTLIERNDTLLAVRKAAVTGPLSNGALPLDFVHQESFLLDPGAYDLSVEVRDLNAADSTLTTGTQQPLVIGERDPLSFSDVQFFLPPINGKEPAPFFGSYFDEPQRTMHFHAELYGTPTLKDSSLAISYALENLETRTVRGGLKRVKRTSAAPVIPVDGSFAIHDLPSGNYLLVLEALDRNGRSLLRKEQIVQRNNPVVLDMEATNAANTFTEAYTDADTLAEYLRSMVPIANELERRLLQDYSERKELTDMQRIMYAFWHNRNGADPQGMWLKYHEVVKNVNRMYGCRNLKGYESDQGRTYLKYGAPNTVVDRSHETSTVPFQIWHYYHAGRYRDKRFVFWHQERSAICWQMLHSQVPGEINNPRWLELLHHTDSPMSLFNEVGTVRSTQSGQEVLDLYNNPR